MSIDPVDYDPFRAGPIARVAPTTEPQREVITAAGMTPEANKAFNEAISLRIRGPLEASVVEAALRTIVDRHDALRMTFTPQLDEFSISAGNAFTLERVDLTGRDADAQEAAIQQTWARLVDAPMSLTDGPLFRAVWMQLGKDDAELVLLAHHVVCDGWSFHVILEELAQLCGGAAPAELPPPASFADFAAEQNLAARSNRDQDFWQQRFARKPAVLDLPGDFARPRRRSFAAQRIDHVFPDDVRKAIVAGAGKLRASVVSVVLAGTAALLHRLTEATDVTVGLPVARQGVGGPERLVGHAVQLLPIRLAIDPDGPFRSLVEQVKAAVLDATEHHDFTFGTLVRSLGLSGDLSRVPLIPVVFNIDQPFDDIRFGAAKVTLRTVPRTAESFEIFLNVLPSRDRLVVEATYNTELFTAATVGSWLRALQSLLSAGVREPATSVLGLPMVGPDSNEGAGASGPVRPLAFACWHQRMAALAAAEPDAIACVDGSHRLTYGELAARSDRLARVLVGRGVRRGDVVGICMQRTHRLLVALAAVHKAGAAHLPLDPAFPDSRLQVMVEDSGARLVLADLTVPAGIAAAGVECLALPLDERAVLPTGELPATTGEDLAYVIYTSGSTGRPKGVEVGHLALANLLASMAVEPGFAPSDVLVSVTTISFDISLLELLVPLTAGGRVVLATREEASDPTVLAGLLERHGATVMQATPSTWRMLLANGWRGKRDLAALCGGEPLPADLAAALLERTRSVWNLYGPTETTVWSTCARIRSGASRIHIGRPIDNTVVHILDRGGSPMPIGCPGEICIGGVGLARGYRGRPDLTTERFLQHPTLGRLYRTGDRGFVGGDGMLHCLGRIDQQVKVRGFRIELGEIEAALAACPGVARAVATTRSEANGDTRLLAFVVAAVEPPPPPLEELREGIRRVLPEYMVPQHLAWIPEIPLLPNGKVDRKSLPDVVPQGSAAAVRQEPRTELERTIVREMQEVLGVPSLGATDGFFDLGGHSLLAAQLASRLNQQLGTRLSMLSLFEAPTAQQLANAIEGGRIGRPGPDAAAIPRRADPHRACVTTVQERMWLLQQMRPELVTYNLPSAHLLRGKLDEAAFQSAFQTVVQRQPALRTAFERRAGTVWQVVHEAPPVALFPAEDLTALPEAERRTVLMRRLDELTAQPFDLSRPPLFRARMFRTGADEHVLFFMPHHIVWDGWSFDLLYEEMAAIYAAFTAGRPCPLPELPIGPGDHAEWLRQWIASDAVSRQRAFWEERLRRAGVIRPLPTDKPRAAGMLGAGASLWVAIGADKVEGLRQLSQKAGATLFATTLTIYCLLLREYAEEARLTVAIPLRGRERPELERMMGCCNGLIPLTMDLQPAATFQDALALVRAAVMESMEHPDLTLEQMGGTGDKADAGGVPYQALFSFQDVRRRQRQWGGLVHEMLQVFQRGATEDLGMWLLESASGLQGAVTYNADLLLPATAERLRARYLELVDAVLAEPGMPLAALAGRRQAEPATNGAATAEGAHGSRREVRGQPAHAEAEPRGGTPLSDLEFSLAKVWEKILGVERVGREDNFFELGGSSLKAIRMVFDFEAMTGVSMELGEVFRSPTLAGLAASLSPDAAKTPSLVVPLQDKGDGPPLLCMLGVSVYRHLAAGLGTAQRVFGLYVGEEKLMAERALKGLPPDVSLERLVDSYVELIVRSGLPQPHRLAGLSFGGVVAMEVAERLVKMGRTVDLVVLLDSILPQGYTRSWLSRVGVAVRTAVKKAAAALSLRKVGASSDQDAPPANGADRQYARALELAAGAWAAQPHPSPCTVVLYRAEDCSAWGRGFRFLPDYGWGKVVGDRLVVVPVPGDHLGILSPPNVEFLCRDLQRHIAPPAAGVAAAGVARATVGGA